MNELTKTDVPSTEESLSGDEALTCMLILTQKLCRSSIPKYLITEIFTQVRDESRAKGVDDETIRKVLRCALRERHSNSLNAALDSMGNFW